jgi:homoserine kinase
MEGHPDNVAPALLGGLVVSTVEGGNVFAHKVNVNGNHNPLGNFESPFQITVVLPDFHIPTLQARTALPDQVPMADAIYNVSRAVLVTEAFRNGDLELLRRAMTDALHQPYRLSLIPGAQEAMDAGKEAGAAAIALSGAGPSLIAFSLRRDPSIGEAMTRAFEQAGLSARVFQLKMSNHGAEAQIR